MKEVSRIVGRISEVSGHVCAWVVFAMMVLILFEATMRYCFHHSPMLADELCSYMVVFLSVIGFAYTWKERGHVNIDVLIVRLKARVVRGMRILTLSIGILCTVYLTKLAYDLVIRTHSIHIRSSSWLNIPQEWPRAFLFVGFLLLAFELILELIQIIDTPGKK